MAVKISNEEGENDVNGKEAIDNVVNDEKRVFLVSDEGKLKRTNPS